MGKVEELSLLDSMKGDLKRAIHMHNYFFDKLVELIPARFYLPADDDKPWFQGLSKDEKALAKKESRENVKKARKDRLDPETNKSTLDLLKQNLEKEKSIKESDDEEEIEIKPMMTDLEGDNRSVTYEELRQRLHRKIEELRAGRNAGSSDKTEKNERNERKGNQQKKRKREAGSEDKRVASTNQSDKVEKDINEASKELAFSHVKIGNEANHKKNKKRKLSKSKELEMAQKLKEAKKDPEKGEMIARNHSWKAATSRAAGIKIHDDPKLLKQSMRKEKKKREKNVEKWNERRETTHKLKAEKQQKRSENIADRIQQKKMRRIEKREKKLLRPGFEGRKQGFVNEAAAP